MPVFEKVVDIFSICCKVGFEVLTAVSTEMAVFWVVAPCSLVKSANVSEVLAASIIRARRQPSPAVKLYCKSFRTNKN
jgi:hypothetical protein